MNNEDDARGFEVHQVGPGGEGLGFEQIGGWDRRLMWTIIYIGGGKGVYVENFAGRECSRQGLIDMINQAGVEDRIGPRCEIWETIYGFEKDGGIGNDDATLVHWVEWEEWDN